MTVPAYEQIDAMVERDPLKLRDLAWELAREVHRLRAVAGEIEALKDLPAYRGNSFARVALDAAADRVRKAVPA